MSLFYLKLFSFSLFLIYIFPQTELISPCEVKLVKRMTELLSSLEEMEPALRESMKRARGKLQKEWTNFKEGYIYFIYIKAYNIIHNIRSHRISSGSNNNNFERHVYLKNKTCISDNLFAQFFVLNTPRSKVHPT